MQSAETRCHANDFKQTAASPVSPLAYNVPLIVTVFAVVTRYHNHSPLKSLFSFNYYVRVTKYEIPKLINFARKNRRNLC